MTHRTLCLRTGNRLLVVELDSRENYEGGTPVMVSLSLNGKEVGTATWNCCLSEGELDGHHLTPEEIKWLTSETTENIVDDFLAKL